MTDKREYNWFFICARIAFKRTPSSMEYMFWNQEQWLKWEKETGAPRDFHTKEDFERFGMWLKKSVAAG